MVRMQKQILISNGYRPVLLFNFLFLFLLLCLIGGPHRLVTGQQSTNLSGVPVAVYTGGHSDENLASRTALIHLLEWLDADLTLLSPEGVLNGSLDEQAMFVMPGISPYTLRDEMTPVCYDIIRNFIASGGAYIGIYGGTFFEWTHFELFNIELQNYLPELPAGKNLVTVNIHKNGTGPDLSALPNSYQILSWTGSYFDAPDMSHVTTIASYALNDLPCMVSFRYGSGAVFLSSPHPEIEEGDIRDGTTFQDGLNDPDSEWNLMRIIACWLIDTAGFTPSIPNPIFMVTLAIVSIIVIVIVASVLYWKRLRVK